jgi:hypothetical protein
MGIQAAHLASPADLETGATIFGWLGIPPAAYSDLELLSRLVNCV